MINFVDFVAIPAELVGGEVMSAVLLPGSEFGVTTIIKENFGVSREEAVEIASFLDRFGGCSRGLFMQEYRIRFGHRDSAVRQAVVLSMDALFSIELTAVA